MIFLVTYEEHYRYDGSGKKIGKRSTPVTMVSHGVDTDTLENVCLSPDPLSEYTSLKDCIQIDGDWYLL